ncbi:MAG: DUF4097 domain-containing protein [Clostridia bacterium]|nr:DUF4097 domain-containing protein [Clostridia bacterium]
MKSIVKALIAGGIIIALGVIILLIALSLNGWKLKRNIKFEMTTYECQNENINLDIEVYGSKVKTEFYDGDKITIEYPVSKHYKTTISEADGTLIFKAPKYVWYKDMFFLSGSWTEPDTVIKLPKDTINRVKINLGAGTVYLASGSYGSVEIDMGAGTFNGGNITCSALKVDIGAGTATIESAQCQSFNCEIGAGTATVKKLTAHSTTVDIGAGSVNIKFTGNEEDYTIQSSVKAGNCNLHSSSSSTPKANTINVDVSAGNFNGQFLG